MAEVSGLSAGVSKQSVLSLLIGRHPDVLETNATLFDDAVRGATSEVVPLVGSDPPAGPRRDLALRCIAFCAASEIEASLFPEQQSPGDVGRANYLLKRYNDLRAQLAATASDDTQPGETRMRRPRGNFPDPLRYPDPIERRGPWTC